MDFKPPKKPEGEEGGKVGGYKETTLYLRSKTLSASYNSSSYATATSGTCYTTLTQTVQTTEKVATKAGGKVEGGPMMTPPPGLNKLMNMEPEPEAQGGPAGMQFGKKDEEEVQGADEGEDDEDDDDDWASSSASWSASTYSSSALPTQVTVQAAATTVYLTRTAPAMKSSSVYLQPVPWSSSIISPIPAAPAAASPMTIVNVPANPDVVTDYETATETRSVYTVIGTTSVFRIPPDSSAVVTSTTATTSTETDTTTTTSTTVTTSTSTEVDTTTEVDTSTNVVAVTADTSSAQTMTETEVETSTLVATPSWTSKATSKPASVKSIKKITLTQSKYLPKSTSTTSTNHKAESSMPRIEQVVKSTSTSKVSPSSTPNAKGAAPGSCKRFSWVPLLWASGLTVVLGGQWW